MSINKIKRLSKEAQKHYVNIPFSGSVTIGITANGRGTKHLRACLEGMLNDSLAKLIHRGEYTVKYADPKECSIYTEEVKYVEINKYITPTKQVTDNFIKQAEKSIPSVDALVKLVERSLPGIDAFIKQAKENEEIAKRFVGIKE